MEVKGKDGDDAMKEYVEIVEDLRTRARREARQRI
jgi:acyl-CoA-binding protein